MGTVPLVDSFIDKRNLLTIISYFLLAALCYIALTTQNKQQATVIVMVSVIYNVKNTYTTNDFK